MREANTLFTFETLDETRMIALGQEISRLLLAGDILALTGDLGAGKTTLARAIIQALSLSPVEVTSPTFTLMQEYSVVTGAGKPAEILHCDLYRLESAQDVYSIGLFDMFDDQITLIEWPGLIQSFLPEHTLHIECVISSDKNTRRLAIHGVGEWKKRLEFLKILHP